MKTYSTAAWVSLLSFNVWAGDFINLDFDSPNLSNLQTDSATGLRYGVPSDLVPGWSITQNGVPISKVWYQGARAPVTLGDSVGSDDVGGYYLNYIGFYVIGPGMFELKTTSLYQQGTIPANAVTLAMHWAGRQFEGDTPVYIDGEAVPIFSDPQTPYDYTADVSKWAGQDVTLSLNFRAGTVSDINELAFQVVPEPSTWTLLGLGLAALGWQYRRRR